MQRRILATLAAALAAPLVLGAGCVASGGDESIIVLKNVLAATSTQTTGCMFSNTATEFGLSSGAVDASFHTGYLLLAQVKSRITALAGQEDQRSIQVTGGNVDITFPGSTLFTDAELAGLKSSGMTHFHVLAAGLLSPNGGILDVPFQVIPPELVAMVAAKTGFTTVTTDVGLKVTGDLAGGEVTSQTFHYPVSIFASGYARIVGACADLATSFTPHVTNPCNAGQDGPVDCCTVPDSVDPRILDRVCPAVGLKR